MIEYEAHFDGETYDAEMDHARLSTQIRAVRRFMLLNIDEWLGPQHFERAMWRTGINTNWASLSARIRDLRKAKFGGCKIDSRRAPSGNGAWEYRLRSEQ